METVYTMKVLTNDDRLTQEEFEKAVAAKVLEVEKQLNSEAGFRYHINQVVDESETPTEEPTEEPAEEPT